MKLAIVLGTRPEIIKLAPIIRLCKERKIDFFIVHSGQHYSPNMDTVFFKELALPKPKYNLHIGTLEYRKRVGKAMRELGTIFEREWPDVVMVQGDTLTVLLGALAAKKLDRPVAHLEAGLRSHDLSMPEENNRIITDHIAEFLYPPTDDALKNLVDEGLERNNTPVFGNTVVDAALAHADISAKRSTILKQFRLKPQEYILITAHRQENVDNETRLRGIMNGLALVRKSHPKLTLFFPIHPRTAKMLKQFSIPRPKGVVFAEPLGYLDFLHVQKNARLCITDSGGVQEEATVFQVPCVTVRDNTERPETVIAGMNILAGTDPAVIEKSVNTMLRYQIRWKPLYGDGTTANKILDDLEKKIAARSSMQARIRWIGTALRRMLTSKRTTHQ